MRSIFVNLPVKDLDRAKRFYEALGFTINAQFTNDLAACVVIEPNIYVMLLTEPFFQGFLNGEIADAFKVKEVMVALSCEDRAGVDRMVEPALANGGAAWKPAQDHAFMYVASFQDPDGHVWEPMWMDPGHVQEP